MSDELARRVRLFWEAFQATAPFEGAYVDDLNDPWLERIFTRLDGTSATKLRVMGLLDGWRSAHDFMYVKRRDDEEWEELTKQIRQAIDGT